MKLDSLEKLLVHHLKDLYSAETQIITAMPKMIKHVTAPDLRKALEGHLDKTKGQARRLERVFELVDSSTGRQKCVGMEGLIEEGSELMKEDVEPEVLDAGLVSAAQKIEHYEIAGYGTVITYAELLGMTEVAKLLQQSLAEEDEADLVLTQIAEKSVNMQAVSPSGSP